MKIIPKDKADEFNLIGRQIIRQKKLQLKTWIDKALEQGWD